MAQQSTLNIGVHFGILKLRDYCLTLCFDSSNTLEEILNGWMEGLADDINGFSEQSLRVSQWDIQLRENQRVCTSVYIFDGVNVSYSFN